MLSLFSRTGASRWETSEFSELPAVDAADSEPLRDYLLLAGGLALLLSRCSPRAAQREFGAALQAYRALKVQLKRGFAVALPAHLLNELSHEIALCADQVTREAAGRCFRRTATARRAHPVP